MFFRVQARLSECRTCIATRYLSSFVSGISSRANPFQCRNHSALFAEWQFVNVAVVGSGISAIAVAHALVKRRIPFTILVVGESLDHQRQDIVARFRNLPPGEWAREDLTVIQHNSTNWEGALPKKVFFGSDRIYANDRPFAPIATLVEGRAPYPTFTKGGFSNI